MAKAIVSMCALLIVCAASSFTSAQNETAPEPTAEQEFETDTYNPTDPFMNESLKDENSRDDIDPSEVSPGASVDEQFEADTYNPTDPFMNNSLKKEDKEAFGEDLHKSYPE